MTDSSRASSRRRWPKRKPEPPSRTRSKRPRAATKRNRHRRGVRASRWPRPSPSPRNAEPEAVAEPEAADEDRQPIEPKPRSPEVADIPRLSCLTSRLRPRPSRTAFEPPDQAAEESADAMVTVVADVPEEVGHAGFGRGRCDPGGLRAARSGCRGRRRAEKGRRRGRSHPGGFEERRPRRSGRPQPEATASIVERLRRPTDAPRASDDLRDTASQPHRRSADRKSSCAASAA